jgi:hypothetical protein
MARKIGEGHLEAMARKGLKELQAAVLPESNVAQGPEYGQFGTMTPGEIAADRAGESQAGVFGRRAEFHFSAGGERPAGQPDLEKISDASASPPQAVEPARDASRGNEEPLPPQRDFERDR